ncbi:MAG: hypothetical protein VSS75_012725 [Candidatus Parabeggiatoa sp.]|nr:hypothetical protein [Candidatus Parabeggiatoa sp.]
MTKCCRYIVSVSGTKEVVIPLSDSLATFTVEGLSLADQAGEA